MTKPYLSPNEVAALASLLATTWLAQSLAGSYADAVGLWAMSGLILLLLAWTQSLPRQLRRVLPSALTDSSGPEVPSPNDTESSWEDKPECLPKPSA
jgi:hypothetical protein